MWSAVSRSMCRTILADCNEVVSIVSYHNGEGQASSTQELLTAAMDSISFALYAASALLRAKWT